MNTVLVPPGLPASLAHTSCPSVSNHPPATSWLLSRSPFCSVHGRCPVRLLPRAEHLLRGGLGYVTDFAQRSQAHPAGWPNRVHFVSCGMKPRYGRTVHLRQLPTPCYHDAVAFGYRRVNAPPDGDFHPAMCAPL